MPRPRTFDEKRVIQTATQVFWDHGFNATSMDDLVRHTGLNKSSLYNAFGDKRKLFMLCLSHYAAQLNDQIQNASNLSNPIQALNAIMRLFLTAQSESGINCGCFIANIASELGPHDPEIAAMTLGYIQENQSLIRRTIQRGVDSGHFLSDLDPNLTALALFANMAGALVLQKTGCPEHQIIHLFDHTVDQLRADNLSLADAGSAVM